MDQTLQSKLQTLGALLAESSMDDQVKRAILDNAQELTPALVDELITTLEREQSELVDLETIIRNHEVDIMKDIQSLEDEVEPIVSTMVDEFVEQAKKENS